MKYLVTGGAGFIGSHLVDKLIERGDDVIIVDNLSSGLVENINPGAIFHQLDICDFEKIKPIFQGIDFVFHLAAIPRVPISVDDPLGTSRVNIMGTLNVFKAAMENKVKRAIFASSSAVYGEQEKLPLREDIVPKPISPYGLQKLVGEEFARMFFGLYNLPVISLRYFNVYGPRLDFDSGYSLVLGKFFKQKRDGQKLTIFGDGEQTRGFCYVSDIVAANIKAMESPRVKGGEVFNIGSELSQSVNYLADLIGGEREYLPPRTGDVMHTKADIARAKDLLDWRPTVGLEEGVAITKKWFEQTKGAP